MWVSRAMALRQAAEREASAVDMGVTTIGGGSASVMTRGEQRDLEVFAPGGVVWQPQAGDTVLVVRGGVGCQEQCVVAAETAAAAPAAISPGELYLYSSGGASVYLKKDGSIAVKGPVRLEGSLEIKGNLTLEGDLSVSGNTDLTGRVDITGELYVNGELYRPCRCS